MTNPAFNPLPADYSAVEGTPLLSAMDAPSAVPPNAGVQQQPSIYLDQGEEALPETNVEAPPPLPPDPEDVDRPITESTITASAEYPVPPPGARLDIALVREQVI